MNLKKWSADKGSGEGAPNGDEEAEEYLNKLAESVLSKEKPRPRPSSSSSNEIPSEMRTDQGQAQQGAAPEKTPSGSQQVPGQQKQAQPAAPGEWVREVQMRDANGSFLPGTILVLEDGSLSVFKEHVPQKEYDLVYQLCENGRAVPHGVPLYNYEVEPIGKINRMCLDQIATHNRWDRDMIVFHLLKYRDIAHVPRIDRQAPARPKTPASGFSPKPTDSQLNEERAEDVPAQEKPKEELVRGRWLTIDFGPGRKWEAVYWGKDELGHVVAHDTHDKWSLMHLDLGRFKESVTVGELASDEELQQIEKDFSTQ